MKILTDFDPKFIRQPHARMSAGQVTPDGVYTLTVRVDAPMVECDAADAPALVAELRRVADEVEAEIEGSLSWTRKGTK